MTLSYLIRPDLSFFHPPINSDTVYTKQAGIVALSWILSLSLAWGMTLITGAIAAKMGINYAKDESYGKDPWFIVPTIIGAIGLLVSIVATLDGIGTILTCTMNPEYWATSKILSQIPR